jgi:hypothetical protein
MMSRANLCRSVLDIAPSPSTGQRRTYRSLRSNCPGTSILNRTAQTLPLDVRSQSLTCSSTEKEREFCPHLVGSLIWPLFWRNPKQKRFSQKRDVKLFFSADVPREQASSAALDERESSAAENRAASVTGFRVGFTQFSSTVRALRAGRS